VLEALLVQHLKHIGAARTAKAIGARRRHGRAAVLAGRVRVHGGIMDLFLKQFSAPLVLVNAIIDRSLANKL